MKRCANCGKEENSSRKIVNHHITYDPEETVELCRPCHSKAHHKHRGFETYWPQQKKGDYIHKYKKIYNKSWTMIPITKSLRGKIRHTMRKNETYDDFLNKILDERKSK